MTSEMHNPQSANSLRKAIFDYASERAVISGILHDPVERLDLVQEQLPESAFYHDCHAAAYDVILDIRQRRIPLDATTFTAPASAFASASSDRIEAAASSAPSRSSSPCIRV